MLCLILKNVCYISYNEPPFTVFLETDSNGAGLCGNSREISTCPLPMTHKPVSKPEESRNRRGKYPKGNFGRSRAGRSHTAPPRKLPKPLSMAHVHLQAKEGQKKGHGVKPGGWSSTTVGLDLGTHSSRKTKIWPKKFNCQTRTRCAEQILRMR